MSKHILVLLEGWGASDEALRYAHALAQRTEGKLVLLLLLRASAPAGSETESLTARCDAFLRAQIGGIDDRTVDIERHVRIGDPWSEFCKFVATAERFHMAVWASETGFVGGRPIASHWASRVQRELGCPVVTTHRRSQ
jgi:hypothetical protein